MGDILVLRHLFPAQVRAELQYRTSFVAFLISQAAITSLDLITVVLLLTAAPGLGGWTTAEMIFLYGMATVPFGLADVFISAVEELPRYVRSGGFDRILLRPLSSVVQLVGLGFALRRLGKLTPGVTALAWGMTAVEVDWTAGHLAYIAVSIVAGTALYGSFFVLASSISFWATDAREAANAITYGGQTQSQYPLHIYHRWIRPVLGWGVPLAFVAYVPTLYLLEAPNPLNVPRYLPLLVPLVVAVSIMAASAVWRAGTLHYQSTGS